VREALSETALLLAEPRRHGARCGRERSALAEAEHKAHDEQRDESAHQAGRQGRRGPQDGANEKRASRSEFVADPAADDLEQRVGKTKGAERAPKLRIVEAEICLDRGCRGRDVHPVDVGDEIHRAEEAEHDGRSAKHHLGRNAWCGGVLHAVLMHYHALGTRGSFKAGAGTGVLGRSVLKSTFICP